jgi:hypothetical protein
MARVQPSHSVFRCRKLGSETDQSPGYHVEPTEGKYYKVLLTQMFREPFE